MRFAIVRDVSNNQWGVTNDQVGIVKTAEIYRQRNLWTDDVAHIVAIFSNIRSETIYRQNISVF